MNPSPQNILLSSQLLSLIRKIDAHVLAALHDFAGRNESKSRELEFALFQSPTAAARFRTFAALGMGKNEVRHLQELDDLRSELNDHFYHFLHLHEGSHVSVWEAVNRLQPLSALLSSLEETSKQVHSDWDVPQ